MEGRRLLEIGCKIRALNASTLSLSVAFYQLTFIFSFFQGDSMRESKQAPSAVPRGYRPKGCSHPLLHPLFTIYLNPPTIRQAHSLKIPSKKKVERKIFIDKRRVFSCLFFLSKNHISDKQAFSWNISFVKYLNK